MPVCSVTSGSFKQRHTLLGSLGFVLLLLSPKQLLSGPLKDILEFHTGVHFIQYVTEHCIGFLSRVCVSAEDLKIRHSVCTQ